VRSMKNVYNL